MIFGSPKIAIDSNENINRLNKFHDHAKLIRKAQRPTKCFAVRGFSWQWQDTDTSSNVMRLYDGIR